MVVAVIVSIRLVVAQRHKSLKDPSLQSHDTVIISRTAGTQRTDVEKAISVMSSQSDLTMQEIKPSPVVINTIIVPGSRVDIAAADKNHGMASIKSGLAPAKNKSVDDLSKATLKKTLSRSNSQTSLGIKRSNSKSLRGEDDEGGVCLHRSGSLSIIRDPCKNQAKDDWGTATEKEGQSSATVLPVHLKRTNSSRIAKLADDVDSGRSSLVKRQDSIRSPSSSLEDVSVDDSVDLIAKMDLVGAAQTLNGMKKKDKARDIYQHLTPELQQSLEPFLNEILVRSE
ncbi:hypothetical protein HDU91_004895 [Kappamyces sp. JEL0680]|nr:hypothetical protein HDU91_004895 [Kappamyces sp. JEL0680]